jgi:hypothetical protein
LPVPILCLRGSRRHRACPDPVGNRARARAVRRHRR